MINNVDAIEGVFSLLQVAGYFSKAGTCQFGWLEYAAVFLYPPIISYISLIKNCIPFHILNVKRQIKHMLRDSDDHSTDCVNLRDYTKLSCLDLRTFHISL